MESNTSIGNYEVCLTLHYNNDKRISWDLHYTVLV